MYRSARVFLGCLVGAICAALAAPQAASAVPGGGGSDVIDYGGSGCRQGTAAIAISPEGSFVTVTYSDYTAAAGPDVAPPDAHRACRIHLRFAAVSGYRYTVVNVQYRGSVTLGEGASATRSARYRFRGSGPVPWSTRTFDGPVDGNWDAVDAESGITLRSGPCGRPAHLDIETRLSVDAGGEDTSFVNMISMFSTDWTVGTTYQLVKRPCEVDGE